MQNLVAENNRKIMNNHVFLVCENMQIYYTVVKNQGFARCVFERENQQHILKLRQHFMYKWKEIDTNFLLEKVMHNENENH